MSDAPPSRLLVCGSLATSAVLLGTLGWTLWIEHRNRQAEPPPAAVSAPVSPAAEDGRIAALKAQGLPLDAPATAILEVFLDREADPGHPASPAERQERLERFVKTLVPAEAYAAWMAALGPDPLPALGLAATVLEAVPTDRAQVLAAHWKPSFPGVPEETLRGRAADLVWRLDDARTSAERAHGVPLPIEAARALRREELRLQRTAEASLAPGTQPGPPVRFALPGHP